MAEKLVATENIEFYVLVERMQDINRRLERDTSNLNDQKEKEDGSIETKATELNQTRKTNMDKRRNQKVRKEENQGKKQEAIETTEFQRNDAGMCEQLYLFCFITVLCLLFRG